MICVKCGANVGEGVQFCPNCGTPQTGGSGAVSVPPPPVAGVGQYKPAASGLRFANSVIDSICAYVCELAIIFLLEMSMVSNYPGRGLAISLPFIGIGSYFLYFVIFEVTTGRTIGKYITGTKVVMRDGSRPDFMHILGRTLARIIPFDSLSFLANDVGWHDRLSGTLVVPNDYTPEQVQNVAVTKRSSLALVIVIVLMVLTVGGILSAVVLVSLNSARGKARDAVRISDVRQMQTALDLFHSSQGGYPATFAQASSYAGGRVPVAPVGGACKSLYEYIPAQPIAQSTNYKAYQIKFCLEGQSGGYSPGMHVLDPKGIK